MFFVAGWMGAFVENAGICWCLFKILCILTLEITAEEVCSLQAPSIKKDGLSQATSVFFPRSLIICFSPSPPGLERVKGVGRGRQGLARCTDTQAPLPAQSHSASLLRGKKLSLPLLFFLLHPWNPLGKWEEEGLGA